ncbi:MAG: hypothetical protein AAF573_14455 [Bacteroidota bacterium]
MEQQQTIQAAQQMFLHGSGRKDVIDFLIANGINQEEVETTATNAYLAVKDQRKEMIKEATEEKPAGGGGTPSIILGSVFLIGGIVATMTTDSIWYGAMIVGVVTIIGGITKKAS